MTPPLYYFLPLLLPLAYFLYPSRTRVYSSTAPHKNSPLAISGLPLLGSLEFFSKRWEWWEATMKSSQKESFRFNLAGWKVVGLSGTQGREELSLILLLHVLNNFLRPFLLYLLLRILANHSVLPLANPYDVKSNRQIPNASSFLSSKYSFSAGYAVLFGASPATNEVGIVDGPTIIDNFSKRITALMKREALSSGLEHLIKDTNSRLDELRSEGTTNPFESIYGIVFQLTMRTVGAKEVAESRELLEHVLNLYHEVEKSATMETILFPWLPGPAKIRKLVAGTRIYFVFKRIVDERRKTGRSEEDPLQYLIDQGDSVQEIVEFVIGALFAGLLNSGINAAYVLCYLSLSPHYSSLVLSEIRNLASLHSPISDKKLTLAEQLESVPLSAWESDLPVIEVCLRDSIRIHLQGAALRRNISGSDVVMNNGEVIRDGDLLAYHLADIHMNPSVYKDPSKWDPSRYDEDRAEDKKVPLAYLGWGGGRHPCLGMRFAKLEQNIITAFFIARFEYSLVDKFGVPMKAMPEIDMNSHSAVRPSKDVFFEYKARKE